MAKRGLGKWFGERWVDVKTGEKCGRSGDEKSSRDYPACRPAAVAKKLSPAQRTDMTAKKTGPSRQSWPVTPSGKTKPKK